MLELHPEARAEMLASARWYEQRRAGLGADFLAAVLEGLDRIEASPRRWPMLLSIRNTRGFRRYVLPDYPYALPYLLIEDGVFVLAIAHTRRRSDYWLTRAPR